MSEENVNKLIAMIKEESYTLSDWIGVSKNKVINLDAVLLLIEQLRK